MENKDSIMTLTEVASYLKLSEKTILKMIKKQEIPCTKVANQWRFLSAMVDDWLISQMNIIPKNDLSLLIELEYEFIPISRFLDEQLITFDLPRGSKREVLNELVLLAKKHNLIAENGYVLEKLLEREQLMSTGIGNGIALPHLRRPDSKIVYGPKIILGIFREGIEFNSLDKALTYLVFLILSDSETVSVRLMTKLAGLLRNNGIVEHLLSFSTEQEVMKFFISLENKTMLNKNSIKEKKTGIENEVYR